MQQPSSFSPQPSALHVPSAIERDAFLWMQGRMVELLLRHAMGRFRKTFGDRIGDQEQANDPRLERYRTLAVLFYLRDDLFNSILPRIKRRLSFLAPREVLVEELPPRGRIDWGRTATASWRDRPGEVPLEVRTRQRRRHFATPENLLTVATLLEYRAAVATILDLEATRPSAQAVTHPLQEIIDMCTRELAFPQFAGLVRDSEAIIAGYDRQTTLDLEEAVAANLLPGRNSAYDDLLTWRNRLAALRLLNRTEALEPQPMLGADPSRDNYLYQLWLLYEIGELLQQRGALLAWDQAQMWLTFTWGEGEEQRRYRLQHDQAIADNPTEWHNAPGVRPDFYVERLDRQQVRDDSQNVIWREPGYVLDAKYYRPHNDDPKAPSGPIKRMIADLQLTGERHGALLFAFHGAAPTDGVLMPETATRPNTMRAQFIQPDVHIDLLRVQPELVEHNAIIQQRLVAILDKVHDTLKQPIPVRCHGVFLDSLSADAQGALASSVGLRWRDNSLVNVPLDDMLVCPKPHIAPWRVDLVSHQSDCCVNGALCHIKQQQGAAKPQRLTSLDSIAQAIRTADDGSDDATVADIATRQVLVITRRYAQLLQPNIAHYRQWISDELDVGDHFETSPLLNDTQRETLALARFLWEQIEHIKASNFAGPTLLFTGVLEEIIRITLYKYSPPLCDASGKPLMQTLGTIGNAKGYGGTNWGILDQAIAQGGYWQAQISPQQSLSLSVWVDMIKKMSYIRNDAAHKANVNRKSFQTLITLYFGSPMSGIGVFNGLLLAWHSANHTIT